MNTDHRLLLKFYMKIYCAKKFHVVLYLLFICIIAPPFLLYHFFSVVLNFRSMNTSRIFFPSKAFSLLDISAKQACRASYSVLVDALRGSDSSRADFRDLNSSVKFRSYQAHMWRHTEIKLTLLFVCASKLCKFFFTSRRLSNLT